MVTQRRYSVTGQTPPDDAEAMKARSPKLQPLDTSVQTTSCVLCEGGPDSDDSGAEQARGRKINMAVARVLEPARRRPSSRSRHSCKRSATQLPSPSSPSREMPPKMARFNSLAYVDDAAMDSDSDSDVSDATDVLRELDDVDVDAGFESQPTSLPSTPDYWLPSSALSLPDAPSLEQLQLCAAEGDDDDADECMEAEDYALSISHSRNHSLDNVRRDEKAVLQQHWAVFQQSLALHESKAIHLERVDDDTPPPLPNTHHIPPTTFLTLPPEIRHNIYRHCAKLVVDRPLVYCVSTFTAEMQHPLASVSRLVRAETLAIFYSHNTWTIKVEFKIMYEAFQDWIIRLGSGAGQLRILTLSVRGTLFRPRKTHPATLNLHQGHGQLPIIPAPREDAYCPPDGDASFSIDLSEKFSGGRVRIVRNDGTKDAGESALLALSKLVEGLWEKRRAGTLHGQDWVDAVDRFLTHVGGWAAM
ncbi:hypothetical protein P153DRAFT_22019 [Dothidotthia symphoricarpi CBS 119687]|uniref:F-box domain-containing protein n=1 Tax=Dothidotthia symphoricarpi CBS 119687 TaxID=1392245 RepID=A0A6A6AF53_9PLEO|nr:uncharacterized protein P153DRAFT_22019 [Dothidotthia symphoricarpi CBS 119687]KAF2129574.1 hypothetical protein P153DRAFT_22019 [Dothidotthia symphoricarpi CBS 119687]